MKFFVYNLLNKRLVRFDSEEELIRWFAQHNKNFSWSKKKCNSLFEDIAMNENDTKSSVTLNHDLTRYVATKEPRTTMVLDEFDRVVDPRKFKDKILNYKFSYSGYPYKRYESYEFRNGPVPGIHRPSYHRGSYYRKMRTTQERRYAADTEMKPFIRGRRSLRHISNYWDEIPRTVDHSWKAKKIKKQWMRHFK